MKTPDGTRTRNPLIRSQKRCHFATGADAYSNLYNKHYLHFTKLNFLIATLPHFFEKDLTILRIFDIFFSLPLVPVGTPPTLALELLFHDKDSYLFIIYGLCPWDPCQILFLAAEWSHDPAHPVAVCFSGLSFFLFV